MLLSLTLSSLLRLQHMWSMVWPVYWACSTIIYFRTCARRHHVYVQASLFSSPVNIMSMKLQVTKRSLLSETLFSLWLLIYSHMHDVYYGPQLNPFWKLGILIQSHLASFKKWTCLIHKHGNDGWLLLLNSQTGQPNYNVGCSASVTVVGFVYKLASKLANLFTDCRK